MQNILEKKNPSTSKITSPSNLEKREFDIASNVKKHLRNDLTARGVDVNVVLEVVENAKLIERLNNSVSSNTTERRVEESEQSVIVEDRTSIDSNECQLYYQRI